MEWPYGTPEHVLPGMLGEGGRVELTLSLATITKPAMAVLYTKCWGKPQTQPLISKSELKKKTYSVTCREWQSVSVG